MLLAVFLLHCFLDPAGQAAVLSFSLASLCPCHVSWHPEMLEPSMIASHLVHASTNSLPPLWKASLCPAERLLESQQDLYVSRKLRYSNPTREHGSISLMPIISQPGATSGPPPETGRSDGVLLQILSYPFSERQTCISDLCLFL